MVAGVCDLCRIGVQPRVRNGSQAPGKLFAGGDCFLAVIPAEVLIVQTDQFVAPARAVIELFHPNGQTAPGAILSASTFLRV